MTEEGSLHLQKHFSSITDEEVASLLCEQFHSLTAEAQRIVTEEAVKRGATPEMIDTSKRRCFDQIIAKCECSSCKEELILSTDDLMAGRYQCPICKNEQAIAWEKIQRSNNPHSGDFSTPYTAQGYRWIPLTWGLVQLCGAIAIFWFFGSNIVTWVVGGILLWLAWSSLKIGIWGSQRLLDEMLLNDRISPEAKRELNRLHGGE
jgi:hypothetical protein